MDAERAFQRSILALPDDAGPRLVYADWLQERGDPRGDWLRYAAVTLPALVRAALARPRPRRITWRIRRALTPDGWPAAVSRLVAAACLRSLTVDDPWAHPPGVGVTPCSRIPAWGRRVVVQSE